MRTVRQNVKLNSPERVCRPVVFCTSILRSSRRRETVETRRSIFARFQSERRTRSLLFVFHFHSLYSRNVSNGTSVCEKIQNILRCVAGDGGRNVVLSFRVKLRRIRETSAIDSRGIVEKRTFSRKCTKTTYPRYSRHIPNRGRI